MNIETGNIEPENKKDVSLRKAFLVEIRDRWFSSRKRIILTIGVFFLSFLYGFLFIASYWNPLAKIGEAPIALCSLDQKKLVIQDYNGEKNDGTPAAIIGIPEQFGIPDQYGDVSNWYYIPPRVLSKLDFYKSWASSQLSSALIKTVNGSEAHISNTLNFNGSAKMVSIADEVINSWHDGKMEKQGFDFNSKDNTFSLESPGSDMALTNIKFHTIENDDQCDPAWAQGDATKLATWNDDKKEYDIKNNTDYAQITVPADLTEDFINYVDSSISSDGGGHSPNYYLDLLQKKFNFYLSFQHSYITAKLINSTSKSLPTILAGSLPEVISSLSNETVQDIVNDVSTLSAVKDGVWNGCYGWTPAETFTISAADALSFNDHSYIKNNAVAPIGYSQVKTSETISKDLTFIKGTIYTIPNEEFRDFLHNATSVVPENVREQVYLKNADDTYLFPSIEGSTTYKDATTLDANSEWNGVASEDIANGRKSLIDKITKITGTLMEIPLIATNVTNIINSYLNDRFHFTFELNDIKASINSVYADTDSVKELLSSDQFIASAMLQDPRFMIPDARAPNIHGIVSVQVNGSPYSVVVPLNFGRVVALAAYPTSSDLKNVFQELDLRSAYTANNAPSVYDDVSYHNGAPLDDLLGPFGSPLNLGSDFSRAINSYDLPAASSSNNHDSFTFANNIEHNSIVISDIVKSSLAGLSFDNYVSTITVGEDTDYYGIGLGQYFVCVGIWFGALAQIMVYDKRKRVKRIRHKKWYMSKTMLMLSTSFIQSTVLAVSICILGWWEIGAAFLLQWLLMLFIAFVFVMVIQSLWFTFRDRTMGFVAIVIYMVLNLTAGWGTYPAWTQLAFFHWISYIVPFTYAIHAQGAIIYGIATGTHVGANTLYILENIGILLAFATVFFLWGLLMSKFRERELYYGSSNGRRIGAACQALGLYDMYRITKSGRVKANWKHIPHDEMPRVKTKLIEMFPYEAKPNKYGTPEIVKDIVSFDNN